MGKPSYTKIREGCSVRVVDSAANRHSQYAPLIGNCYKVKAFDITDVVEEDTLVWCEGLDGMFAHRFEVLGPKSFVNK